MERQQSANERLGLNQPVPAYGQLLPLIAQAASTAASSLPVCATGATTKRRVFLEIRCLRPILPSWSVLTCRMVSFPDNERAHSILVAP